MKIKGLVRVFNQVRARLQAGLTPDEVESFRQYVKATVWEVEEICRRSGVPVEHLPVPTLRAYRFLRDLDLENLPVVQAGGAVERPSAVRLKNVVKIGDHFADRLWRQIDVLLSSTDAGLQLRRDFEGHVADIERICTRHQASPASLEAPSKQVYCWLKFLSNEETLALHLESLKRAGEALAVYQQHLSHPVHLRLIGMNALLRKKQYRDAILFTVNEGFLNADQNIWNAAVRVATPLRDRASDQLIRGYGESDEFTEVLFEMESFAASVELPARGRAHNLDESFARVNSAYFGNRMPRPNLIWNRTLTARKFGHYQPVRDTLMVSISLDDPEVPSYLIDFVMYHELLHKKHRTTVVNGRRISHSPIFRAEERRFAQYHEAMRRLDEVALRQIGVGGVMATDDADVDQV